MGDRILAFDRPPHATNNCRHYSFERGKSWSDSGPRCAVGVDLSVPATCGQCMPEPHGTCAQREEWTDAERAAWRGAVDASKTRLIMSIAALPAPIPLCTSGSVECPNCLGALHYSRWHRGAEICCGTPGCTSARFNVAAGADWPAKKGIAHG
jgi:hypothetical protein